MGFSFRKFFDGIKIVPKTSSTASEKGDLEVLDADGKLRIHNGTSVSPALTETHAAVGTNRVQNKELDDSSVVLVDNADTTKKLAFDASAITTGTTRTLTAPDANTVIVGRDTLDQGSGRLKNKDLEDSSVAIVDETDPTKKAVFQVSGITTSTTRTITVPDENITLVGSSSSNTGADRLQNKELDDETVLFVDDGDTTKKMKFQLAGLTTATTRTLTPPDASTTIVGTDVAQQLTNKDIDGGTASNTHRITLPKESSANLASLTRKEGTVAYDTTKDTLVADDGVALFDIVKSATAPGATGESVIVGTPVLNGNIQLKKLIAGSNITLTPGTNDITIASSGGGGGGSASALETLEQKLEAEKDRIFTDKLDNSVGSSFEITPAIGSNFYARLLTNYTASDANIEVAWTPVYLNADVLTDSTTGWSVQSDASGLTTDTGTKKLGTASLSFDKAGAATNARIQYDVGSLSLSVINNTRLWFYINLPSLTDLVDVEVRIDIDNTNYSTYSLTTDYAGNALATGWNLMFVDLAVAGSQSGTGWIYNQLFRYFHVGVNTGSAATSYTAILIDSITFGLRNSDRFIQPGDEFTISNASTRDIGHIDIANTLVDGPVALAATFSNSYSGSSGSNYVDKPRRNFLVADGNGQAVTVNGFTGPSEGNQEFRISRILRSSQTGINIQAFVDIFTRQNYEISAVGGGSIDVIDATDDTADIVSGDIIHIFQTVWNDGEKNCVYIGDLTVTSSSHSSGITTINGTPPGSAAAGDFAVKKHVTAEKSLVSLSANENFSSLSLISSPNGIIFNDDSTNYPNEQTVYAHWYLGGETDSIGLNNNKGPSADLNKIGSPNLQGDFLNGQYSATNFSTSNYLQQSASTTDVNGTNVVQFSVWFKTPTSSTGTRRPIFSRETGGSAGFSVCLSASAQTVSFYSSGGVAFSTGTFKLNDWNHLVVKCQGTSSTFKMWLNGNLTTSTSSFTPQLAAINIGRDATGGGNALGADDQLADLIVWDAGPDLTQSDVDELYNGGNHQQVGFFPHVKYRYEASGLTGQKLSLKAILNRTTQAVSPFIRKMGIIKTS